LFDWFDADLVGKVADKLRDWQIDLIGPHQLSAAQSKALNRSNIRLLGRKDYLELPSLLAAADVAMIPFVINDLIRGTSPIKLYEYLAAGVPVVATPMPEVLPYTETGVVACAEGPTEFARAVKDLAATANPERCQEIARESSWDARFMGATKSLLLI
jgi:glycosyltransferase involved in cell wall biosynthesis